jgi:large subunit ribosomal protein L32
VAVPKKKSPRSTRKHRRSHHKLPIPATQPCPKCNEPKLPHRVCTSCGHYKNLKILEVEE